MKKFLLLFFLSGYCLTACKNEPKLPAFNTAEAFLTEIIIPAGQTDSHSFLPYPGNLGSVANNENTKILVLAESVKTGTLMAVRPIGTLVLKEENQIKNIIIATPIDSLGQLSSTTNFRQFIAQNAGEKQILQDWFLYQKGVGKVDLVGWKDEKYAWELMRVEAP